MKKKELPLRENGNHQNNPVKKQKAKEEAAKRLKKPKK